MKTKIVYSDEYYVDIGAHVFPTAKYRLIEKKLESDKDLSSQIEVVKPDYAGDDDILLVHEKAYLKKLKDGTFTPQEILTLELPYSKELVKSSFLCCGGTMLASKSAVKEGLGIHLGGGFHHAFPDHGEGFCVLNDIAVAVRKLKKEDLIKKAMIIDCDLHQGNGTAFIFKDDKDVFTFSIHQENNYPFFKPKSDLDIGLLNRTKDKAYLAYLEKNIPRAISDFKPDFIMYVAGADPYEDDQIGNLGLTLEGLKKRDEYIFTQGKNFEVPIAVVLAGGYAYRQEDTVNIHFNTVKAGIEILGKK
ncbi:MAG: histone deacetylase [Candidatus Omnitrophica bacterium]|nr:histone deacetylase [Candidatus Omnitrophota bacterium]